MEKVEHFIRAVRCGCAALAVLLLSGIAPVFAETPVGGVLSSNRIWTSAGSPYIVTSDVIISGATLTVEAGVVVRFQAGTRLTVQTGALRVAGTAAAPVLFTSWRNTTGNTPAAGDWGGLQFQNGTNDARTVLDHATISYGGTTTLAGAAPTFNNCSFENNSGYALSIDLMSFPRGTGNTASGNGVNAIRVPAGEMTVSGSWELTSIPYYLDGEVSIGAAPRLTGLTPGNVEQGSSVTAALTGTRLAGATTVSFTVSGLTGSVLPGGTDISLPVQLTAESSAPLGPADITATVSAGSAGLAQGINVIPPIPRITGVSPDRIFIDRPSTTIDISGRNFTAGSTAYLNGSSLVTTITSSVLIHAVVPTQPSASLAQLVVKNPDPRTPGAFIDSPASIFTVELPQFTFAPGAVQLHQGDSSSVLGLTIPFAAPAGGVTANLSSTNTSALTVPATVTIPEGSTSVPVTVSALDSGSTGTVVASVRATGANWSEGTGTVTILPRLTVNLTPLTTMTGNGWSYYLTVALTEPAPISGVTITLTPSPAGIVTCPATVTIPQGATTAQVTVTAINPGIATISATAPSPILSGTTNAVTVRAVQIYNVNPVVGQPVGVLVSQQSATTARSVSYTPIASQPVGVAVGAVITGLTPDHAAIGTADMTLRILGSGLASTTTVSFAPSAGITVQEGTLVATDTYVEVHVSIADDGAVGARTVVLGGVSARPAAPAANLFRVTYQPPQLWSLIPNYGLTGTTFTLQVNGRNLQQASEIAFVPADGIGVGNPPTISSDGTLATVSVTISANTGTGMRAVMITAPGGATPSALAAGNSFDVRSATPPPGSIYTGYSPVVSRNVGILVQNAVSAGTTTASYTPLFSRAVGVVSGATTTSLSPTSGALGTTGLLVRVQGAGLASAASMTFKPGTGITVRNGSFSAAPDGSSAEATIDIDENAPVTRHTVVLGGVSAWPAVPGANLFSVTYKPPQLWSLLPNYGLTGTTFTLQVNGRNLQQASTVAFVPSDGISVGNPPTVSSDGTLASVSVTISANTGTGTRAVTLTAPGGTTSEELSAGNSFEVRRTTPPSGSLYAEYAPILAPSVGVMVTTPTATTLRAVGYGPVESVAVGVTVQTAAAPTTASVQYSPVISLPVGVTVGSSITGVTPTVIRPGTTTNITILGTGLSTVNAVQIQPSAGFTIGAVTPAPDGLSALVSVTSSPSAPIGPRTIVVSSPSGTVRPAAPGATMILAGPAPAINSIVPISQDFATSFSLTINGTNLQGTTEVRFSPTDGILVHNPPVYSTDAQGEHLTVTVSIDVVAPGGQRVVIVKTAYGESDSVSSAANTFTVVSIVGWNREPSVRETVITAKHEPPVNNGICISGEEIRGARAVLSTNLRRSGEERAPDAILATETRSRSLCGKNTETVLVTVHGQREWRLSPVLRGPPQKAA